MPDEVVFAQSKCRACQFLKVVAGARSEFLMCTQGGPPRYPPQPVKECSFFVAAAPPRLP